MVSFFEFLLFGIRYDFSSIWILVSLFSSGVFSDSSNTSPSSQVLFLLNICETELLFFPPYLKTFRFSISSFLWGPLWVRPSVLPSYSLIFSLGFCWTHLLSCLFQQLYIFILEFIYVYVFNLILFYEVCFVVSISSISLNILTYFLTIFTPIFCPCRPYRECLFCYFLNF